MRLQNQTLSSSSHRGMFVLFKRMEYETKIVTRTAIIILPLLALVIRLMYVLPSTNSPPQVSEMGKFDSLIQGSNIMVFLGSGGHTGEMMKLVEKIDISKFSRIWAVSSNDTTSILKCKEFENNLSLDFTSQYLTFMRARAVGEPLFLTIKSTLLSFIDIFQQLKNLKELPDVLLLNGPGTSVPIAYILFLFKFLGLGHTRIIYIESLARVTDLSLSSKLLLPISDRFIVQWPQLAYHYKRAEYYGILI